MALKVSSTKSVSSLNGNTVVSNEKSKREKTQENYKYKCNLQRMLILDVFSYRC